jgi:hypothetical protein
MEKVRMNRILTEPGVSRNRTDKKLVYKPKQNSVDGTYMQETRPRNMGVRQREKG